MKVLVIGSGGREHALAWKLAQSPKIQTIYVAPGNGGTASDPRLENVALSDFGALAAFVEAEKIVLTVVGPETPLAGGIVDFFRARGLRILGPTQAAAQLESSKAFAKDFMRRYGIPTASYATFTEAAPAHAHVNEQGVPIVIKADGLAAGKGVVVATTLDDAHEAIDSMLGAQGQPNKLGVQHNPGSDGLAQPRVVIESFLQGEEASFIVLCDGKNVVSLATSQDHKRLLDGDRGPNTGGMGAYSPAPIVTPNVHARVMQDIIMPTIAGLAQDGIVYTGFLYAGLMINAQGQPFTIEFNCRLGDPETQAIMMRLKSDLFDLLMAATEGNLSDAITLEWDRRVALGVVMAAAGYPLTPRQGDLVSAVPSDTAEVTVFHAGTTLQEGRVLTAGGRVLCVTALGDSIKQAQQQAYETVNGIRFAGSQYRRDIGFRAVKPRGAG